MVNRKLAFLIILLILGLFLEAQAQRIPEWAKNWEYWAEKTGDPEWALWAKKLQSPKAIRLGQAWIDYLGYDSVSLAKKSKIAPNIKPGVVITSENYLKYPGLKELCPPYLYRRIQKGTYASYPEIRIAPTTHYYNNEGYLKYTKMYEGRCKVGPNGELLGWKAGIPFSRPKTGMEMVHNFDRLSVLQDNHSFNPLMAVMFDRKGKLERVEKLNLFWRNYMGRVTIPPIPEDPVTKGEVYEKGSMVMVYPYDLKGYCGVRVRFVDLSKEDSFELYLPFLRRIRKLSGTDTQDPIVGTDLLWEDWKAWWQKISNKIWPMECKYIGEREILGPVKWLTPFRMVGDKLYTYWERHPCWLVEVNYKTKLYVYSKRRVWFAKDFFFHWNGEYFDIRGNLYRDFRCSYYWDPENGDHSWWGADILDVPNSHRSIFKCECIANDPKVTDDYFSLGWLRRLAH